MALFRRKKKKVKIDTKKRAGSFAFYLSIPLNFLLAFLSISTLIALWPSYRFQANVWAAFAVGFIGFASFFANTTWPRFETFIHELKHAVVVVLTGNKVTDFHVDRGTGHVQYQMQVKRSHFTPFIALAPYSFPLLSLPVLIACLFLETDYRLIMALVLGCALGTDLMNNYEEIHPHQTDLKRVFGGFVSAGAFIIASNFFWTVFTLIWVLAGRNGYVYLGYALLRFGTDVFYSFAS